MRRQRPHPVERISANGVVTYIEKWREVRGDGYVEKHQKLTEESLVDAKTARTTYEEGFRNNLVDLVTTVPVEGFHIEGFHLGYEAAIRRQCWSASKATTLFSPPSIASPSRFRFSSLSVGVLSGCILVMGCTIAISGAPSSTVSLRSSIRQAKQNPPSINQRLLLCR